MAPTRAGGRQGGRSAEAFGAVYDDHVWDVYGFFGYRLGSRQEAEDLTQQTFERALRAWKRFDSSRASARTWLLAIAHNLLVDHYRRDRHEQPLPDRADEELGASGSDPSDLGMSPELEAALGRLGQRERELLALRFGGDMTGPEIAELTGLTLANVQQILSRALRRLRAELEGRAEAELAQRAANG